MKTYCLFTTVLLALTACTNHAAEKPIVSPTVINDDSIALQKQALTKIYTQAIADYLKENYKKDKQIFDTLYFGKHVYGQPDDFPDIELPVIIENTTIKLVSPKAGEKLMKEKKQITYINLMGWVDKDRAEFTFVTFGSGGKHNFDCFLVYNTLPAKNDFQLQAVRFENYIYDKTNTLQRMAVYQNGKQLEDKLLK